MPPAVSTEHKLVIRARPTAVLVYGEKEVAIGYLLGEENRGLEYMFVMMNHACSCADHVLSQAQGLRNAVIRGAAGILALSEDQF